MKLVHWKQANRNIPTESLIVVIEAVINDIIICLNKKQIFSLSLHIAVFNVNLNFCIHRLYGKQLGMHSQLQLCFFFPFPLTYFKYSVQEFNYINRKQKFALPFSALNSIIVKQRISEWDRFHRNVGPSAGKCQKAAHMLKISGGDVRLQTAFTFWQLGCLPFSLKAPYVPYNTCECLPREGRH